MLVSGAFQGSWGWTCSVIPWVPSRLKPRPMPIFVLKVPSVAVIICLVFLTPLISTDGVARGPADEYSLPLNLNTARDQADSRQMKSRFVVARVTFST